MPRQESFNGGELAPELYSKTGFAKYESGAKRLRNFLPARSGAAMSRPGTAYLGPVKGGDVVSNSSTKVRLIPFIYSSGSTAQNYVLEFGDSYFRVWNQGALVAVAGTPIEVVTPYVEADLPYLKYVQSGDVLEISCLGHDPAKVTRASHTSWTHGAVDFTRVVPTATPVVLRPLTFTTDATHPFREWTWQVTEVRRAQNGRVYETAPVTVSLGAQISEWDSATAYASGTWVTYQGHFYKTPSGDTGHAPTAGAPYWNPKDDAITGLGTFSLPLTDVVYPDKPRTLALRTGTAWTSIDPLISTRIYRGRADPGVSGGVFGWVGDASGATFTDVGDEPDFSQPPPQGRDPFKVYDASGTLLRTEQPAAVAFFEERLVYAGTTERPAFAFASSTGDYANFDSRLVPVADEELEFELASRRHEEIRSALGEDALFLFTGESVWEVGGQGGPLTFDNISARRRARVGASWVDPIATDQGVLYVRNGGAGVRLISYELERQGYVGSDLSELAAHLFRGHQVVDWTYAEKPWSVVWAVRDDGVLLSFTFDAAQQVWAWAWHDTLGTVEAVCAIPEGTEDAVYVVTRRTCNDSGGTPQTTRYVERFDSRVLARNTDGTVNATEAHALDCSKTYRGPVTNNITGLGHLEGQQVYAVADGQVVGPLTVTAGAVNLGLSGGGGWTVTSPMVDSSIGANVFAYGGRLYRVGRQQGEAFDASPTTECEFAAINPDGTLGAWASTTPLPTFPIPGPYRFDVVLAFAAGGHAYAVLGAGDGGSPIPGLAYSAPINSDGTIGTWADTAGPADVSPSGGGWNVSARCASDSHVYRIGGRTPNGSAETASVEFAPFAGGVIGAWSDTTALPVNCEFGAALVYGGHLYAIGGQNAGGSVDTVYVAPVNSDGSIGAWSSLGALPVSGQHGAAAFVANGSLIVYQPSNGAGFVNQLYSAAINPDGSIGAFALYANQLPSTRQIYPAFAVAGSFAYCVGGEDGSGAPLNSVLVLSLASMVAHVGLAFTPQLQTLEPARGEARAKPKIVTSVAFEVVDTRGVSVGQDFAHLVSPQISTYANDVVRVAVPGAWRNSLSACLQQSQPLPVTVTALIIETEVGG